MLSAAACMPGASATPAASLLPHPFWVDVLHSAVIKQIPLLVIRHLAKCRVVPTTQPAIVVADGIAVVQGGQGGVRLPLAVQHIAGQVQPLKREDHLSVRSHNRQHTVSNTQSATNTQHL